MISIEGVSKSYATRSGLVPVLRDVTFSVALGEKVAILGRNGAGKSTLVRLWRCFPVVTHGPRQHAVHLPHIWPRLGKPRALY